MKHVRNHVGDAYAVEIVNLATGEDRRDYFVLLCGGKNEALQGFLGKN